MVASHLAPMKEILFVQPTFQPPGGGNGVATWMLQSLVGKGRITLLTLRPFEADEVDSYYGTSLGRARFTNIVYRPTLTRLLSKTGLPSGLFQLHLLMKGARRYAPHYDLVCSAFDEQDFGTPSIEYIHYPWNLYPRPDAPPGWNESRLLRRIILLYNAGCRRYSGFRPPAGRDAQNITLVNSDWTGRCCQKVYPALSYRVLHPPALSPQLDDDRTTRQARFLSVGRVARSKEWHKLIDIVVELRRRGHDVGLTLAGSRDQHDYEREIRERIVREGSWLELKTDLSRQELLDLMLRHQYGLHGMRDEHYGMAVAELVLGGCLTMVPDDGGQVEIVTDPRLRYTSIDEAVDKWEAVLGDQALFEELLEGQQRRRRHLRRERFQEEFSSLVDEWLSTH